MAYVYEYLYRGRVREEDAAYHVIIGDVIDVLGEKKHVETPPLTAAQAEAMGFPLPRILAEINTVMLNERDAARQDSHQARMERDRMAAELDRMAAERDRLETELRRVAERPPIPTR